MFNLFTNVELLIMGSVVGFLLLIVIILLISDVLERKKESRLLKDKALEIEENRSMYRVSPLMFVCPSVIYYLNLVLYCLKLHLQVSYKLLYLGDKRFWAIRQSL